MSAESPKRAKITETEPTEPTEETEMEPTETDHGFEQHEYDALKAAGYDFPFDFKVKTVKFKDNFLFVSVGDDLFPNQYRGDDRNHPMFQGKKLIIMLDTVSYALKEKMHFSEASMLPDATKRDVFDEIVGAFELIHDEYKAQNIEWPGNPLYCCSLERMKFYESGEYVVVFPLCGT